MDESVKRRAVRERLALSGTSMAARNDYPTQVISPALTRRPDIDSMLGDIAYSCKRLLETMRIKLESGDVPERSELRDFKETCETVLRQAKTEIELEKHADSRQGGLRPEELREIIQSALSLEGIDQGVIDTVHGALGLSPTNSESSPQVSVSA
jgi:hypothetical protein